MGTNSYDAGYCPVEQIFLLLLENCVNGEKKMSCKERREIGKRRTKSYYVQVQVPSDECDHYGWQICTLESLFIEFRAYLKW